MGTMPAEARAICKSAQHRDGCPSCGSTMRPFFEVPEVPTNSCILMKDPEEARSYPRGDIVLGFCDNCGFIRNLAFDAALTEYSGRYEETQGFSPTFRKFHQELAADLIRRYDLRDKEILEIGCGKGEFLALLCDLGGNLGIGFDPGYDENRGALDDIEGAGIVKDFYSPKYAGKQADLVCCKMTLEHIQQTADFVRLSRHAMRSDGSSVLYFQVPESLRIFRGCAFEDIYYEHCSYFTPASLSRLFLAEGLKILRLYTGYSDQYLAIEAALADRKRADAWPYEDDLAVVREQVEIFPERCGRKIADWQARLSEAHQRGPVVVWGSGSKAVAFLGAVDTERVVDRVVDINPNRQGYYMPGTAQPIVSPDSLREFPPSSVIVMNAVYSEEIAADLEKLGLKTRLLCL